MGDFLNEMAVMMSQTKSNVSLCWDPTRKMEGFVVIIYYNGGGLWI